jgi:hypothetical protein
MRNKISKNSYSVDIKKLFRGANTSPKGLVTPRGGNVDLKGVVEFPSVTPVLEQILNIFFFPNLKKVLLYGGAMFSF